MIAVPQATRPEEAQTERADTRDEGCLIRLNLAHPLPVGFGEAVERIRQFCLRVAERLDQAIFHRLHAIFHFGADFCEVLLRRGLGAVFHADPTQSYVRWKNQRLQRLSGAAGNMQFAAIGGDALRFS